MTTKLQDLVWSILPKEFKEEVKYEYHRVATKATKDSYDLGFMHAHEGIFGIHNLTSDAEEEEMLTVSRKEVIRNYKEKVAWKNHHQSSKQDRDMATGWCNALRFLFGSKCLSDENASKSMPLSEPKPSEPMFKVGQFAMFKERRVKIIGYSEHHQIYRVHVFTDNYQTDAKESDLEPYTEPKEENHIGENHEMVDTILKDSFRNHNRLQIAAMATGSLVSSDKWNAPIARLATQEDIDAFRKEVKRQRMVGQCRDIIFENLSDSQLEQILEIVSQKP